MKEKRFKRIYSQGVMDSTEIWVDQVTGVNYLYHAAGYSGGLTPLLDAEGKPVISPASERYDKSTWDD
ncbi:MAG: xylan 1,4-beta-xylosidase [Lachnospiraceae bacterium]|nr:xylan 1,4-beta-xylosidase [Lachnospiraceae bacterium]